MLCQECRQNYPTDRFLMNIFEKGIEDATIPKIFKTKAAKRKNKRENKRKAGMAKGGLNRTLRLEKS